jgi:signal transduction histidine kinase
VSHDLRAPLRAINGFGEVLEREYAGQLDDRGRDFLRRIQVASNRMSDLIEGMLVLGKVSRAELHRGHIDLSALAKEIIDELREGDPDRVVNVSIEPGLVAHADRKLMQSVLQNLLGNAWKYTRKSEAGTIEFARRDYLGRPCYLIADNGIGFDTRYAQKLFTPFHRMPEAMSFPGLGIGLATVKRIIERHGGSIWAEAEPGKGAAFYFTLRPDGELD